MNFHEEELKTFKNSIKEYVEPLVKRHNLSSIWQDDGIYSIFGERFSIHFYCTGAHTYSFNATVSPDRESTDRARGFYWLVKYVGKHNPIESNFADLDSFENAMRELSNILPAYIDLLLNATPAFWKKFNNYTKKEIRK